MAGPIGELKAVVTADVTQAQAAINETIKAVEKMGDSINVASLTGVRAFRSEAAAAKELLTTLGATEKQHTTLANNVKKVESQVDALKGQFGQAARGMAIGAASMIESGNLIGGGIRGIITQGANMAFMFGSTGPIVGAIGIAVVAIADLFVQSQNKINDTAILAVSRYDEIRAYVARVSQEESEKRLAAAEKEAAELQKKIDAIPATTTDRFGATVANNSEELQKLQGALKTTRAEAEGIKVAMADKAVAEKLAKDAAAAALVAEQLKRANAELDEFMVRGGQKPMAPNISVTGDDPRHLQKIENKEPDIYNQPTLSKATIAKDSIGAGIRNAMVKLGDDAESQADRFVDIGSTIGDSLYNGAKRGLEALVTGHGNVIKVLKKAATEPIVTYLQAKAKEEIIKSGAAALSGNVAAAGGHAALAAAAIASSRYVAQLGGISAGSGGGGGSSGGAFSSTGQSTLAEKGRGKSTLIVKGSGLLNMSDGPTRDAFSKALNELIEMGDVTLEVA